jgi:nickel-dependent lactate racemase
MDMVGRGVVEGYLSDADVAALVRDGLAALPVDGTRVLLIVPDGTRTMPMPRMFALIQQALGARVAALDVLIALGTHTPMSDAQLTDHLGQPVVGGMIGPHHIFNHRWDDPSTFLDLGTIPARDIAALTGGLFEQDVTVSLNRLAAEYDHVLICGPVFPHEVAGFSGGTKYLFPGIAAPPIIHFTHWLGAVITSATVIGTANTPVRAVIDRAAAMLATPLWLLAPVVTHEGIAGLYCGDVHEAWRHAATLSARRHIVWVDEPFDRIVSIMPAMYDDLWTAAKGAYKAEPAIAEGGEIVVYAPHVSEVSYVHGKLIDQIGYHCRDYFIGQWEKFRGYPGGILAHSTHVKGQGTYDVATGVETPRATVTLSTGIPAERCARINLGYLDPASVDLAEWPAGVHGRTLVVPRAGEQLFRVGRPPEVAEAS